MAKSRYGTNVLLIALSLPPWTLVVVRVAPDIEIRS